jgi:hypothetical protein
MQSDNKIYENLERRRRQTTIELEGYKNEMVDQITQF